MSQALIIKDLTKTYAGGVQALKGISLEVAKGDFFRVAGAEWGGQIDHLEYPHFLGQ